MTTLVTVNQTAHSRLCCKGLDHTHSSPQKSVHHPLEIVPTSHSLSTLTARSQHLGLVWFQELLGVAQVPDLQWTQGAALPLWVPTRQAQLFQLSDCFYFVKRDEQNLA